MLGCGGKCREMLGEMWGSVWGEVWVGLLGCGKGKEEMWGEVWESVLRCRAVMGFRGFARTHSWNVRIISEPVLTFFTDIRPL